MTPESAAAAETGLSAKTMHCANVKANKLRVFITLVGSECRKIRIPDQANYSDLLRELQIKRTFIRRYGFKVTEQIIEKRRLASPATTPQALAWDSRNEWLWMGSRDLRRIYAIDPENGTVLKQQEAPGIPWAAVALNGELRFTIGEGETDDRYIYRYTPDGGFSKMFACPEFTGSYLSFDGKNLYTSQWYKKRVLKFDDEGNVLGEINVGAEICGHTFANGSLYVLRGQEQPNEDWRIARLNPQEEKAAVEDIAVVPFACRSLTFDGELFWSNYRAKDTIISFTLPN